MGGSRTGAPSVRGQGGHDSGSQAQGDTCQGHHGGGGGDGRSHPHGSAHGPPCWGGSWRRPPWAQPSRRLQHQLARHLLAAGVDIDTTALDALQLV